MLPSTRNQVSIDDVNDQTPRSLILAMNAAPPATSSGPIISPPAATLVIASFRSTAEIEDSASDVRKATSILNIFKDNNNFNTGMFQDFFETLKLYGKFSQQNNISIIQKASDPLLVFDDPNLLAISPPI